MVFAIRVKFDSSDFIKKVKKYSQSLPEELGQANYHIALTARNNLRNALVTNDSRPMSPARMMALSEIQANKVSRRLSTVTMPQSLINLDSLGKTDGRYVAVRWGSSIRRWATQVGFPSATVSGRSRFSLTRTGQIEYRKGAKSALYVTGHQFIDRGLRKTVYSVRNELRGAVSRAISKAR
jgi:hypothetical protein